MSIFSGVVDFVTGGLSGGLGTAANIALNVAGSLFGGGDDEASGQGFADSRVNQQTQEAQFKGEALTYAERLRRLGGVYDPMKYGRGQGATQQQSSRALQNFYERYRRLSEANPYYAKYSQMGRQPDPTAGMSVKTVSDSLSIKSTEIEGESKKRLS